MRCFRRRKWKIGDVIKSPSGEKCMVVGYDDDTNGIIVQFIDQHKANISEAQMESWATKT